jgi:tetratricopeptide (TPR) repeat protein
MRAREGQAECEEAIARLLGKAESTSDQSERVEYLQQAAEVYELQMGELEKAATVWQAAFGEDFTNERSGQGLERVAQKRRAGKALTEEMRALIPEIANFRQRAALSAWVGRWLTRFTDDRAAGEAYLLEALRVDPGSKIAESTMRALAAEIAAEPTPAHRAATGPRPIAVVPSVTPAPRVTAGHTTGSYEPVARAPVTVMDSPSRRPAPAAPPPESITQTLSGQDPQVAEAMHRRLDALVEDQRWPEAVDVLKALAAAGEPAMRAKYLTTAAKIVQRKVGNDDEAVELFNRALDVHPDDLPVFEQLYQLLAGRRAWRELETNLLRMIARIKTDHALEKVPVLEALWRRLGDIYRVGLEDPVSATNAYQMCARLAPQDPRYPSMIAQLAEQRRR